MSYRLTIAQEDGYLHATVTGANTMENVTGYLRDVQQACSAHGCFRLLIEERLEGPRLSTIDVYQIASSSEGVRQFFRQLAYVDVNGEGDLMKFAETVAVNRGLPVRMFATVAEARDWLMRTGASQQT
jgi:hypothetical protein